MGTACLYTPPTCTQVYCLKELRELDASGKPPEKFSSYVPEDPEVRALLSRDRAHLDDPYKAAISDTLIITMKGVAAGVQWFAYYAAFRHVP